MQAEEDGGHEPGEGYAEQLQSAALGHDQKCRQGRWKGSRGATAWCGILSRAAL